MLARRARLLRAAFNDSELGAVLADPAHPINQTDLWIAGDDAHKGPANDCRSMLTPYPGKNDDTWNDAFNAFQSVCRIEVECAFGALTGRWGVLKRALTCKVEHAMLLLEALTKLHNICTEAKLPEMVGWVMQDEYCGFVPQRSGHRGGDLRGERTEWPEWRCPRTYFDPPQHSHAAQPSTGRRCSPSTPACVGACTTRARRARTGAP